MKDAKVEEMRTLPLFQGCGRREVTRLAALCDRAAVQPGRELAAQGGVGLEFFVVVSGEAEVRRGDEVVATLQAGDFFGELALLDHRRPPRRSASVVATTPMSLYVFDARGFASMLHQQPAVGRRVAATGRARELRSAA